jgi:hypothetical protein
MRDRYVFGMIGIVTVLAAVFTIMVTEGYIPV